MTTLAPIEVMTADEARTLTDEIKGDVANLLPKIKRAFEGRADLALGYTSWPEYCDAELRGLRLPVAARREAVAELRQTTGMSTRAIAGALGVDKDTVNRDLRLSPLGTDGKVKSLDGRERPAAMPQRQEVADQIVAGIDAAIKNGRVAGAPVQEPPATPPQSEAGGSTPRPPKWDPAEREAHEAEVLRIKDIEAAHRFAKTLVPDVRTLVLTVLAGYRLGERHLVTRQDIADIRRTIDLLEKELDDHEE